MSSPWGPYPRKGPPTPGRSEPGTQVRSTPAPSHASCASKISSPRRGSTRCSSATTFDRFPGSTVFSISRAVLQNLKAGVSVPYSLAAVGGAKLGTGWASAIGGGFLKARVYARGTLAPAQPVVSSMSLLVNGRRSTVPAVHAKGSFTFRDEKIEGDFFMLDDAEHPLLLRAVFGTESFQMIRVDFPEHDERSAAASVEADLVSKCRAEIPGVYFEFGSADLRPESDVALADVGRALNAHPDWKLSIEGHTDAVGSPAANLTLSQRRAEAVRTALSTRYHVAASRLTAAGFGQTKPREPNTSLEGRARNRRVEMVRACPARP